MVEFLKKAAKPLATAALIAVGIGAASWFSDPKNFQNFFLRYFMDVPVPSWTPNNNTSSEYVVLHADELRQLRWMSTSQLKAIFEGRRKNIRVDSSPAAYQELRWMSTEQIKAIFGSTDIPKSEDA